ncbi:molybdopterin-binding/glycosyltransferase family 2 protein [Aureimonas sp. ME7]|uniref:NTP transferase domain-containing protein n=1 Tax=Aureimonas sp. ME7 TaxID=2744252 RepID=UPI0015F46861|nr:molybdopterin-binding/glycosyltransferase family 2 protein [Aureimonas sp. ME7]
MKFGPVPLALAEGARLAHANTSGGRRLAKGHALAAADLQMLAAAGIDELVVARLDDGDIGEDEAAGRIARALASRHIETAPSATGRANLYARTAGLLRPDRTLVDALNRIHSGITLATLQENAPVAPGRMVATVKIIPLAVPGDAVRAAERLLQNGSALDFAPFRARRVGLLQTVLPQSRPGVLDKTRRVLESRLAPSGSQLAREVRCAHSAAELSVAIADGDGAEDVTIVFGASAVIDAEDVVPNAIRAAGGTVEHLGMPVDPGNLLLIGRVGERIVIGAPGCARSPAENGFDWVLDKVLADIPVTTDDLTAMGVGGLLMEIASRPKPRETRSEGPAEGPRIGALVLAAGQSRRMGGPNKLLARFEGVPLVRRSVETVLASRIGDVVVVTGHMGDEIGAALEGLPVRSVRNPRYAEGLSTSLALGFAELVGSCDGILVVLADQPFLTAADLGRLIAEFSPVGSGSIVMATDGGQRANPVILSSIYAAAVRGLEGDIGARPIVQSHRELVREVEIGSAASFDVDTPERLRDAGGIVGDETGDRAR